MAPFAYGIRFLVELGSGPGFVKRAKAGTEQSLDKPTFDMSPVN